IHPAVRMFAPGFIVGLMALFARLGARVIRGMNVTGLAGGQGALRHRLGQHIPPQGQMPPRAQLPRNLVRVRNRRRGLGAMRRKDKGPRQTESDDHTSTSQGENPPSPGLDGLRLGWWWSGHRYRLEKQGLPGLVATA